ncbi:MAG: hypothetical protein WBF06_08840 [Candidatus Acidiferrales bacterium]
MARRGIVRGALVGTLRDRRLWLLQFFANPVLAVLFAVWLLIPVANAWYVVLNVLVALVIAASVVVLHGGTLDYFRDRERDDSAPLKPAFVRALRHVLAIAVCVAVFYLFWRLMDRVDAYQDSLPAYLRSIMPVFLRRHITLGFLESAYGWKVFALRWLIVPGLILPFVIAAADRGFSGFGGAGFAAWKRAVWCLSYWVLLVVAVIVGVLATQAVMAWTPNLAASTFRFETISLVVRAICAYDLGLWAWVLACYAVAHASSAPVDEAAH